MNRAELKQQAKNALGNNIFGNRWMTPLLLLVVTGAILALSGTVVPALGALLISGAVLVGISNCFLKQVRTNTGFQVEDATVGFQNFGDTFLLGLLSELFIFLWSLLFVIPGIIKSYAYSMCYYIKVDHPEYDWKKCIDESRRITKGHKWELFVLDLSFIGWYFVGMLCFGVGVLWVETYREATKARFYESIR